MRENVHNLSKADIEKQVLSKVVEMELDNRSIKRRGEDGFIKDKMPERLKKMGFMPDLLEKNDNTKKHIILHDVLKKEIGKKSKIRLSLIHLDSLQNDTNLNEDPNIIRSNFI